MLDPKVSTRGERNHNPGNIIYTPHVPYKGMLGRELVPVGDNYAPIFAQFDTDQDGIRAIAMCLLAYNVHHGLNTISQLVHRWSETDQAAYTKNVTCWFFNLDPASTPDATINSYADRALVLHSTTTLVDLIPCFIRQENGRCLYSQDLLTAAVEEAQQTAA